MIKFQVIVIQTTWFEYRNDHKILYKTEYDLLPKKALTKRPLSELC
jgi:hypothetical protein